MKPEIKSSIFKFLFYASLTLQGVAHADMSGSSQPIPTQIKPTPPPILDENNLGFIPDPREFCTSEEMFAAWIKMESLFRQFSNVVNQRVALEDHLVSLRGDLSARLKEPLGSYPTYQLDLIIRLKGAIQLAEKRALDLRAEADAIWCLYLAAKDDYDRLRIDRARDSLRPCPDA